MHLLLWSLHYAPTFSVLPDSGELVVTATTDDSEMDSSSFAEAVQGLVPLITRYVLQVLGAVLILILGRMLSGIAALAKFGIQTTSFVAVLGAAGLAVGLALQGSLANFAAGVMILTFKPVRPGDLIEASGYLGIVKNVGLFVTTIDTLDNQRVIIPNAVLTGGVINNVNANGIRRVDLLTGISYGDDIKKTKALLAEILDGNPKVLADPAPNVAVFEFGDSSVNLVARPWCKADDYWDVWFEVQESIKERFDVAGVTIPFPQRDIHMVQGS